ncbi:MAG: BREX-2 system adenine-specific DNA-methyltransferase PglX [Acidimicrobiales bacterium]
MIDAAGLLTDTKSLVRTIVDDLRVTADPAVVGAEYDLAKNAHRTSLPQPQWAEGLYAQVAVSWVLGCMFVRFCEDNGLVDDALLSGPGNRRDLAREQRAAYLSDHPAHDDRDWLRHVFTHYRALPATGDIFGGHNPLWLLEPSADGTRLLLEAFHRIDPETGVIAHVFTDSAWSTRFLGDLYQDLSEHAKKQYALLQTPVFVEEFILDHTLEPAIATFGLRDTDLIDPTCGSGHFLLGAFHRLFAYWVDSEPGTSRRVLARRALDAVAGVDINAFAVGVARFRLLVAALRAGGDRRLVDAPSYPIHIAVGDSLLHRDTQLVLDGIGRDDDFAAAAAHGYATEDAEAARVLLSRPWAVVVGNPPYITVKDPALNDLYRKRYVTCHRQYSLGVPFTERFWQLARHDREPERAGYVGMITANSFMKREFGKKLIENWVPTHDVTHVIDTSGAYIPGHGTPTVILFGRNRRPVATTVRAVMGIRGEPTTPADASKGLVWTSIVELLDQPGTQSEYVSVTDLERQRLCSHPWSIGGGGAAELKDRLDAGAVSVLQSAIDHIGYTGQTNADEAMTFSDERVPGRFGLEEDLIRPLVVGEAVRDWGLTSLEAAFVPYRHEALVDLETYPRWLKYLWPLREVLLSRATFAKRTYRQEGRPWYEWHLIRLQRLRQPLSICFANVATHNHFVLERCGSVLNPHAPAIKLLENSTVERHLELLGVLNSSTACFWMKQVFSNKGVGGIGGGIGDEKWEPRFEFDGTKLQSFPLPASYSLATATALDRCAAELAAVAPVAVATADAPTGVRLREARGRHDQVHQEMIGLQEQLDWEVYGHYRLLDEPLTLPGGEPPLQLGERAFEIVLARRIAAGEETSAWFVRHGATPITELPGDWPADYRVLVERRIEVIDTKPEISLIEQPEYKRRWSATPWEEQQRSALRDWLLDRLESPAYWPEAAAITSTARLAARARADGDFMAAARLWAERDDVDVASVVKELVTAEAVPYLAAYRYKDSGLRKWAQWLQTWEMQRREDRGEDVTENSVPPHYTPADFQGVAWTHRGKLDVPKERFISYPGAQRETDASLPIGWAGWDHLERARALATWYLQAKRDGRDTQHLRPLLAGLAELVPWLLQWHDDPNLDPALDRPGAQIAALVDAELRALHLVPDDLTSWRPAPERRGRSRQ